MNPSATTTFADFVYKQPDMAALRAEFEAQLNAFSTATHAEAQHQAIRAINRLRANFDTMQTLCYIRHTIDTTDAFYEAAQHFFDENTPHYQDVVNQYYRALVASPFRAELEAEWGSHLFALAELSLRTFSPQIVTDLQEENRLRSEYTKLKASAHIAFDGKTLNLSGLVPYEMSADRAVRKAAADAKNAFFATHAEAFGNIYHQLVQVRHRIAQQLGYANFIQLGYDRLSRAGYTATQVAAFREAVRTEVVPYAATLYQRQAKRIGVSPLLHYDLPFKFKSGNPQPKGSPEWIVNHARTMYAELSPETHAFFTQLTEGGLMDLLTRQGKATGGYCTFLLDFGVPFIFSNFNGTSNDIDVLTHEAGHAFQAFSSREERVPEYLWPTLEACEIHSMSMEFFTWRWMHLFFEADTAKYQFHHLAEGLLFLPYGVAVDEFQHWVYAHPDASPADRNAQWRSIEQQYLPHLDYREAEYLAAGGFWHRQGHIFEVPFYYIDYALAQICAFQFWEKDQADHAAAWERYHTLCKAGGSKPFLELVALAGLQSPFENQTIRQAVAAVRQWLDAVDDAAF